MKKLIYLTFLLTISNLSAQINPTNYMPDNYPVAPNAYSFLKYGEIPVSKYTGVPDISIPIYTIQSGNFKLPISLNYHSSGIKVTEEAGWTGLGWNLSTGGEIVQVVYDFDDFGQYKYRDIEKQKMIDEIDHTYSWSYLNSCTDIYFDVTSSQLTHNDDIYYFEHDPLLTSNTRDQRPDIFKFNLLGYSGEFILDWATEEFVCLTDNNIEITSPNYTNGTGINVPSDFVIKYPDGNAFIFEKMDETAISGIYGNGASAITVGTTSSRIYRLKTIRTTNGEEIQFVYSSTTNKVENLPNVSISNVTYQAIDNRASCRGEIYNQFRDEEITYTHCTEQNMYYLSEINFPLGKLKFNSIYDRTDLTNAKKLERIELLDLNDIQIKAFDFSYDYFVSSNSSNNYDTEIYSRSQKTSLELKNRLKLLSVKETGKPPYLFEYDETSLPQKSSWDIDPWGYYKGNLDVGAYSSLHESQASILKKITYPTLGTTEFEYELNSFTNVEPTISMAITESHDLWDRNTSNDGVKHAVIWGEDGDYFDCNMQLVIDVPPDPNCTYHSGNIKLVKLNKTESIQSALESTSGAFNIAYFNGLFDVDIISETLLLNLEYDEIDKYENIRIDIESAYVYVVEVFLDDACGPQGSPENHSSANASIDVYKVDEIITNIKGGGLRIKKITSKDNDEPVNVKNYYYERGKLSAPLLFSHETSFNYDYFYLGGTDMLKIECRESFRIYKTTTNTSNFYSEFSYVGYDSVTEVNGTVNVASSGEDVFEQGKIKTQYINESYDGALVPNPIRNVNEHPVLILPLRKNEKENGLIQKEETYNSNNELVKFISNSYTYSSFNCWYGRKSAFSGRYWVSNMNYGGVYINTYLVGFYPIRSSKTLKVSSQEYNYYGNDVVSVSTSYDYDEYDQLKETSFVDSNKSTHKTTFKYPYNGTSYYSNLMKNAGVIKPVIETSSFLNGAPISTIKTDYKVLGTSAPYLPLVYTNDAVFTKKGIESTFKEEVNFEKYGAIDTKNEFKLLQYNVKDALTTIVIWGYEKQYPIAKIENASFYEVATALGITETELENYDESNLTQISSLRSTLTNAMITTYTYDPLIGVTSITDPKGYIIYYEYDDFNRLKYVKDADGNILSENEYNYKQ